MTYVEKLLEAVTPEVYQRFKQAIETRKWPSGQHLTPAQMATCMEAVIAYDLKHLPPEERVGYVQPKESACDHPPEAADESPLKWQ